MLQDPRPIKPLQHALCELLRQLGIEFLPSQWRMQETLIDPTKADELTLLRAYPQSMRVALQVVNAPALKTQTPEPTTRTRTALKHARTCTTALLHMRAISHRIRARCKAIIVT